MLKAELKAKINTLHVPMFLRTVFVRLFIRLAQHQVQELERKRIISNIFSYLQLPGSIDKPLDSLVYANHVTVGW